jgi:carbonic anhydrase
MSKANVEEGHKGDRGAETSEEGTGKEVEGGKKAKTTAEDDLVVVVVILLQLHEDEKDNRELAKLKLILKRMREQQNRRELADLQLSLSQLLPSCGNYFRCYGSQQHVGSTWMVYARPLPLNAHQLSQINFNN